MLPRHGDVFECQACAFQIRVLIAPQISPLALKDSLRCVCGSDLRLLQSGSESVDEQHNNKILRKVQSPELLK